jgi:hypothetical protein
MPLLIISLLTKKKKALGDTEDCVELPLSIRPSDNPPSQKAPLLYEGVSSIFEIFKIYLCVNLY